MRMHNPPHPGKVLREFLGETTITAAAKHLHVSRATLSRILNGKAGISADMSLRLSAAYLPRFGTSCKLTTICGRRRERSSRGSSRLPAPHNAED